MSTVGDFFPDAVNCPTINHEVNECVLEMTVLTAWPYNLAFGDIV